MKLTGFSDEASRDLGRQIAATKALGWSRLSARTIGTANLHDLSDEDFGQAADRLDQAGIEVTEIGSLIGNWSKKITADFSITVAEVERTIPRMKRLGTGIVRIMSYAQEPWESEQHEHERFRRLREIVSRFADHGLTAAHENCMNWGGFSATHTLRLIDEVPGLKLVFDTGNPVFQRDRSKARPHPWQDSFYFWEQVRDHVVHIHVKDCVFPIGRKLEPVYTMPGEGNGHVRRILLDAKKRGYAGYLAIEPHVATVFHARNQSRVNWGQCYDSYIEYGRRMESLVDSLNHDDIDHDG